MRGARRVTENHLWAVTGVFAHGDAEVVVARNVASLIVNRVPKPASLRTVGDAPRSARGPLSASCRVVGDKLDAYPDAALTVLPMTVRPLDAARHADLELHFMLSSGESVKGKPELGIISNSGMRKVTLKVVDK